MINTTSSIGIFDSGFGGLTVMKALRKLLPHENMIYFGDTARVPYGNKSAETIARYSLENALFLKSLGIKVLVIACHTACAYSLSEIEQQLGIPVVGVINRGIDELLVRTKTGSVAVLSTRATAASGVYQQQIIAKDPLIRFVITACPLFVPLIEEGYDNHLITEILASEYLEAVKAADVDSVLLACTHFPLIESIIQKELGSHVHLIDPALSCAYSLSEKLISSNLLNPSKTPGATQFFVSDDPEKFRVLGEKFLSNPIPSVTCTAVPALTPLL